MLQIGQWCTGLLFPAFQRMTKFHYAKRGGQSHNYDLPYVHFDVLMWYYSYHYGLVFVLLLLFNELGDCG